MSRPVGSKNKPKSENPVNSAPNRTKEVVAKATHIDAKQGGSVGADDATEERAVPVQVASPPFSSLPNRTSIMPDEEIACRSVTFGELVWVSRSSSTQYTWAEFDDVQYVKYSHLREMKAGSKRFISEPLLIVCDERVIEDFRLGDLYKKYELIESLDSIVQKSPSEITGVLEGIKMCKLRSAAVAKIRAMRENGLLSNVDTMTLIQNALKFYIG